MRRTQQTKRSIFIQKTHQNREVCRTALAVIWDEIIQETFRGAANRGTKTP